MTIYRKNIREIDLDILRENVRVLRGAADAGAKLMAVVKADAYGHGLVQTARAALSAGADALAVAMIEEGEQLRAAGVTAPILVLGATSPDEAAGGVRLGLTLTVCDANMVHSVEAACKAQEKTCEVHLKIDSGMCRIGVRSAAEARQVLAALAVCPHVRLTGAFTHFADADGETEDFTRQQFARFQALTALLPAGLTLHAANSASIHRYPDMHLNMVRMGISMYGYPPVASSLPLRPCMTWRTEVTYVKDIQPGDTVSYGRTFRADKPMRVATVAAGYGDGYHRAISGKGCVLIGGRRAPILGRVCMDQLIVDVTDIPSVQAGDEVVLLGRQGGECIDAEEMAAWAGTISYEVLLAATNRVPRVWLHA